MGKAPQARADRIEGANNGLLVPINSGALTAVSGTVKTGFVAPFDGYIVRADLVVTTVFNNTTSSVHIGTFADPDSMLDDFDIEDLAAGYYDLIGKTWVSKAITKGTAYSVGFTAGGTTGVGIIGLILAPNPGLLA